MIFRLLGGGLFLCAFSAFPSSAQDITFKVQGLYNSCKGSAGDQVRCMEYLSGVGELMTIYGVSGLKTPMTICGKATFGAYQQAFINWAEKNPGHWNDDRIIGAVVALHETWPCSAATARP